MHCLTREIPVYPTLSREEGRSNDSSSVCRNAFNSIYDFRLIEFYSPVSYPVHLQAIGFRLKY